MASLHLGKFWTRLRFYDKLSFGYLWLTFLIASLSAQALPIRDHVQFTHFAATLFIITLILYNDHWSYLFPDRCVRLPIKFLRDWHPLFLFTFLLFGEFTYLANAIFPYWMENYLIAFDLWLLGQPLHRFVAEHFPWWGIELMAFAYWSYYPLILGVVVLHYFPAFTTDLGKPKQLSWSCHANPVFIDCMNRLCLAFYSCYVLFMILPARSPRHALNLGNELPFSGGMFFDFVAMIQSYGAVVGAAFPSSHVAVAWVALFILRQNYRTLYRILLPFVVLLTLSVFILQYHYALDAVAGVVLALMVEFYWHRKLLPKTPEAKSKFMNFPLAGLTKKSVT
ncbi:MAG: phosphatase PAP2 family protein [candidate division KSB1 bacterium]|nr:phosphatase PAP2 family protein [candidate division KSB1 bacterium]